MNAQVTVRTNDGIRSWKMDGWTAIVAVGALSSEPVSFLELEDAMRRYLPKIHLNDFEERDSIAAAEVEGEWHFIDLIGRTVVSDSKESLPVNRSGYGCDFDEGEERTYPRCWICLSSDWELRAAGADWKLVVEERAAEIPRWMRFNFPAVLYGEPLLRYLAKETLSASRKGKKKLNKAARDELTQQIHAAWLLTPRDDLGGITPREAILNYIYDIESDIQNRANQWSEQRSPTPPVAKNSFLYRRGPFGLAQVVVYFETVRSIIDEAWRRCFGRLKLNEDTMVGYLKKAQDAFLDASFDGGQPARHVIEAERKRLPLVSDTQHLDCDCPMCISLMSDSTPTFSFFDGHQLNLYGHFAFSLYEDEEEWNWANEPWEEASSEVETSPGEDKEDIQGDGPRLNEGIGESEIWESSYVNWDLIHETGSFALAVRALGAPLSELVSDLSELNQTAQLKSINALYARLCRTEDADEFGPLAAEFQEELERIAQNLPALASKSADLQSRIDETLRRYCKA